jgi:hypothetical protein
MKGCEICHRERDCVDVLCGVCRETITRLARVWMEQPNEGPHNRSGARVGHFKAEREPSPANEAEVARRGRKPRRVRSTAIFEGRKNLPPNPAL